MIFLLNIDLKKKTISKTFKEIIVKVRNLPEIIPKRGKNKVIRDVPRVHIKTTDFICSSLRLFVADLKPAFL
jgi:hypothetical protein